MTADKPLRQYRINPDVVVTDDDDDLDKNPITLPSGKVLDNAAAEKLGHEVADRAAARRKSRGA